jgi:hypothetical protein
VALLQAAPTDGRTGDSDDLFYRDNFANKL